MQSSLSTHNNEIEIAVCIIPLFPHLFFVYRSVHFRNGCTEAWGRVRSVAKSARRLPRPDSEEERTGERYARGWGAEPGGWPVRLPGGGTGTQWGLGVGPGGSGNSGTPRYLPSREPLHQVSASTSGLPRGTGPPMPLPRRESSLDALKRSRPPRTRGNSLPVVLSPN